MSDGEQLRDGSGNRTGKQEPAPYRRMSLAESERQKDWEDTGHASRRGGTASNKRKNNRLRRWLIGAGCAAAVIYLMTAVYFGRHFYENTEIIGIDCSQMTAEEAGDAVSEQLGKYRLEILERGGTSEYLTAEQIQLAFADDSGVEALLRSQKSWIWPVMILLKRNSMTSVAFTYNEKEAYQAFSSLNCMNEETMIAPKDAYVKTEETKFVVEPEIMGTTIDAVRAQQALTEALSAGMTSLSLEEKGCYVDPKRFSDDEELIREAQEKSELARADIVYDFGDREERVNAQVIADWITTQTNGSYVIDDVRVSDYVADLAAKYDTFGLPREFQTSIGTTVTLNDGDYGWSMDQHETFIALLNALEEGYQGTMEPVYAYTAMSRDTNDIGGTYVEICISRQEMWCYQDNVCIVDTPVVTGNPNKGNATPSGGVWAVDAKQQKAVLVGEGYQAPVDYWIPFNGNIGIHDLQTRAYFGGTIYLTNGSHGCINTPYAAVQTIYNTVSVGTPVIVYD